MPWDLTGNKGTNPTDFLGTGDAQPLVIKTNDTERMRITPDGYITMAGHLYLKAAGETTEGGELQLRGAGSHAEVVLDNQASALRIITGGQERVRVSPEGDLFMKGNVHIEGGDESFLVHKNNYYFFAGVNREGGDYADIGAYHTVEGWKDLVLNRHGGNVGIGIPAPRRKLDVLGEVVATNRLTLAQDASRTTRTWHLDNIGDRFRIFDQPNIDTGGTERLSIDDAGNVRMISYGYSTLTVGAGANGEIKVRHINGKHSENDNHEGLYLNWGTGQPVRVGGGGATSNLIVEGNVGIGTDAPTHKFHCRAGEAVGLFESTGSQAFLRIVTNEGIDNRVEITNRPGGRLSLWTAQTGDVVNVTRAGNVGIGTMTPGAKLDVAGEIWTHDVILSSDARLKTGIEPITGALEKLQQLRGVAFEWRDPDRPTGPPDRRRALGLIAQEVEAVLPELVDSPDPEGYKGVHYSGLLGVLVEASKELQAENHALRRRVEALERVIGRATREMPEGAGSDRAAAQVNNTMGPESRP